MSALPRRARRLALLLASLKQPGPQVTLRDDAVRFALGYNRTTLSAAYSDLEALGALTKVKAPSKGHPDRTVELHTDSRVWSIVRDLDALTGGAL